MRILVCSPFFHPDHSGSAPYSTDLSVYLAQQGHEVTVVTAFPFYPSWKKRPEDRKKLFETGDYMGLKVLRGYLYVPKNPTAFQRILHELSFTLFTCLNFLRAGRHDCIILSAIPIPTGLASLLFKFLWNAQLVIHVQDLQADAALSLGMLRHNPLTGFILKLEVLMCRRASWVATITLNMKDNLKRKGVPEDKLYVYPNWIDIATISKLKKQGEQGQFISSHPVARGKFVVAYAGNIGAKQDLEVLIDLAEASQSYEDIHYFIIGEGSHRAQVKRYARSKALNNLTFLPFLTQNKYFEMLQDIDVSFVAQRSGTGDVFFPGKLLGIMAMSKPLLVSADLRSELATVVSNVKCGLVSAPADLNSLLENTISLYDNPYLCESLGRNGYEHVQMYDREQVLSRFLGRITEWSERTS